MTPRLPRVTARQTIRILEKRGFEIVRQSGSHVILRNEEGKRVTVPAHARRILKLALLRAILRDAGLSLEEFSGEL